MPRSRRTLLALSAATTAFILVILGAVGSIALRPRPNAAPAPVAVAVVDTVDQASAPPPAAQEAAPVVAEPVTGVSSRVERIEREDEEHHHEHRTRAGRHHERHEHDDG